MDPTDPRIAISSDETEDNPFGDGIDAIPGMTTIAPPGEGILSDGDTIDAEFAGMVSDPPETVSPQTGSGGSRKRLSALHKGPNWESGGENARDATTKPPTLDEWTNFFGKVLLRVTCDWYLSFAFRGIDEDSLSERELERLALSDDERKTISTPLAELSSKSKFMRKHGRTIVASGDAFNALMVLGVWMSRVNRIAAKYRPKVVKGRMNGSNDGYSGQGATQANGATYAEGTTGGRVPNGYRVYNPGGS